MNNQITIYKVPENPNIKKGVIYTFYLNNNTNLDLSSLKNECYNKLLNLYTKRTNNINKFLEEDTAITKELIELTNQLIKGGTYE